MGQWAVPPVKLVWVDKMPDHGIIKMKAFYFIDAELF